MSYYFRRSMLTLIWLVVTLLLTLSLISYSANDPSWSHLSSDSGEVSNLAGSGGAWLADILYNFLGAASWWLVVMAAYEGWRVWYNSTEPQGALRTLGYIFLIIATAGLTGVLSASWLAQGIVGQAVGQGTINLLSYWGALIFLMLFILVTVTFTFNFNWQALIRHPKLAALLNSHDEQLDDIPVEAKADNTLAVQGARNTGPSIIKKHETAYTKSGTASAHKDAQTTAAIDNNSDEINTDDVISPLADFLHESGLSEIKEYEGLEENVGMLTQPIDPNYIANTKLTKKLDAKLQTEIIKPSKPKAATNQLPIVSEPTTATIQTQTSNDNNFNSTSNADVNDSEVVTTELPTKSVNIIHANASNDFDDTVTHVPTTANTNTDDDEVFASLAARFATESSEAEQSLTEQVHDLTNTPHSYQDESLINNALSTDTRLNTPTTDIAFNDAHLTTNDGHATDPQEKLATFNEFDGQVASHDNADFDYTATVAETYAPIEARVNQQSISQDNEYVQNNEVVPQTIAPQDEDALYAHQSRAMQTAAYRATLSPIPDLSLLDLPDPNRKPSYSDEELKQLSALLEIKLQEFNIKANVINALLGPVVTRFEVELAPGVKASKVTGIAKDLARSLSMPSVRVVEVIPGKPYIGIEVPNPNRQMVRLIELLKTEEYQNPNSLLSMAMGKDIAGYPIVADLAKAPHMLVAGTTGSGKSVLVNSLLLSMLLKYTPEQLRLILIDPKQLELANYNDIPHLLTPVVTDMTEAASALSWCVAEMERRYQLMALFKVRKLDEFNKKIIQAEAEGHPLLDPLWRHLDSVSQDKPPRLAVMPQIVIVADEFADMIMQVGKQAEELITRLAQKSRAAGIHLILATQRPSVDVITGLIKANIPVRAALRVNSKVDSRTILDAGGAEDMLGHGDMLFLGPGQNEPNRVHGAFISDAEVNRVCDAWRERGAPNYIDNMFDNFELSASSGSTDTSGAANGDDDALYDEVVAFVAETRKVSASSIQRKFSIGYNRAARIVDAMEANGIVSPMGKSGKRELLI